MKSCSVKNELCFGYNNGSLAQLCDVQKLFELLDNKNAFCSKPCRTER